MNCEELHQDINNLTESLETLRKQFDNAVENGAAPQKFNQGLKDTTIAKDKTVTKYFEEIKEKNPELVVPVIGEKIEGFEGKVWTVVELPDQSGILASGENGEIRIGHQQNGKWEFSERISSKYDVCTYTRVFPLPDDKGFIFSGSQNLTGHSCIARKIQTDSGEKWGITYLGENFVPPATYWQTSNQSIQASAELPDKSGLLVGGTSGALHILSEVKSDHYTEWEFSKQINGFEDAVGRPLDINCIAALPGSEEIIIGGSSGAMFSLRKENGEWQIGDRIFNEGLMDITHMVPLPDGSGILVGGKHCTLFVLTKENDKWVKKENINSFKNPNSLTTTNVKAMTVLPDDGGVLIGALEGTLYRYHKEGDTWKLSGPIQNYNSVWDMPGNVENIAITPDKKGALISGDLGAIYTYTKQNGVWELSQRVKTSFPMPKLNGINAFSASATSNNGDMIICAQEGVFPLSLPPVDELVSRIIEKHSA